jgi:hypothetical protein
MKDFNAKTQRHEGAKFGEQFFLASLLLRAFALNQNL